MASQLSYLQSLTSIPLFISFLFLQLSPIAGSGVTYNYNGITGGDSNYGSLIQVKIWCAIILLISTFAGGLSPYFLRRNDTFLLLGTQFAGGVFLETALFKYLGDWAEIKYDPSGNVITLMFSFGLVGYLVAMFVNCLVTKFSKKGERESRVEVSDLEDAGVGVNSGFVKTAPIADTILLLLALCAYSVYDGISVGYSDYKKYIWRSMGTTLLHQIPTAVAMSITLLKMLPKRPFLSTLTYSIAFAVSSPIGVGIGIGLNDTSQGRFADWIYAYFLPIACGFLLYVALNHLIAKGFRPQKECYFDSPFYKFLAVFVGVALMFVLEVFSTFVFYSDFTKCIQAVFTFIKHKTIFHKF